MTRIGLLSDSHNFFDNSLGDILKDCDEIWHAGDLGSISIYKQLTDFNKPVRAVYGNIDGNDIRKLIPLEQIWNVESMKIYMIHIGGYPGKYPAQIRRRIMDITPGIFVCGHSHILKVIYDKTYQLLHLNPGASGREGFHKVRTALRFIIDNDKVQDMEIIELGLR